MVRGRSAFNEMNSTYKRNRDIRFSLQRSEMFIGSSAHAKLSLAIALLRNFGVKIRIVNYKHLALLGRSGQQCSVALPT